MEISSSNCCTWEMAVLIVMILLVVIITLFGFTRFSLLTNYYYYYFRRNRLPSGSLGWPFLGETLDFISCAYSDRPEIFMDRRRLLYGKVFKSHIFGNPTIISTDGEVNKSVLIMTSDSNIFVPFYPKSLTKLMGNSSILLINGSLHRKIHGLISSFLKSPLLKHQITSDMHNYVLISMSTWSPYRPVYIQDQIKNIAFQVLVKALISLDTGEEMEFLRKQFQLFIAGIMSLPINFPGTTLYRSLQAKKRMVKLIHKIIQSKRKNNNNNNNMLSSSSSSEIFAKDVAEVLLSNDDIMMSNHLTDELISDNIIDLMIPGEDSVPVLITLAVKYLSDSPSALQQLTEENLRLKRLKEKQQQQLTWSDYLSLPFTQNVITETLRMGNVIIGVMRKAMKDVEIKGNFIPKGWCVFTYFRSVHLDHLFYDSPYNFNPWRWEQEDKDRETGGGCSSSARFSPFGGGQRLCPGLELARLEASIFLHLLVTHFRWVAEEDSVVNFPTVRMKRRLPVWVKRRTD